MMPKVLILCCLLSSSLAYGKFSHFEISSGDRQKQMLELYSSEGCSSCPPADRWLAKLRSSPNLWDKIVPVEFHVDYWNYLGWADPHSNQQFSQRQRHLANQWNSDTVYTPGFALNGQKWRISDGFKKATPTVGNLKITRIAKNRVRIQFEPKTSFSAGKAHLVLLGNGLVTKDIPRGENRGKTLRHEFVVLDWQSATPKKKDKSWVVELELKNHNLPAAESFSVVAWIERAGNLAPFQAAGGDIKI